MSARLLTDISTAKPQINCRSWDNIVDGTLTLSPGSTVVIPSGTLPVDVIEPGPINSVIRSNGSTASWSATPTVNSVTFSAVTPTQTALTNYAETASTPFNWTAPGGLNGVGNAKYIRIGSMAFMSIEASFTAATLVSGTWTLTGIPAGFRPLGVRVGYMPYTFVSGGTGVHSGQQQMVINADGTAQPFGPLGTSSAAAPNDTTYSVNPGTVSWSLI